MKNVNLEKKKSNQRSKRYECMYETDNAVTTRKSCLNVEGHPYKEGCPEERGTVLRAEHEQAHTTWYHHLRLRASPCQEAEAEDTRGEQKQSEAVNSSFDAVALHLAACHHSHPHTTAQPNHRMVLLMYRGSGQFMSAQLFRSPAPLTSSALPSL